MKRIATFVVATTTTTALLMLTLLAGQLFFITDAFSPSSARVVLPRHGEASSSATTTTTTATTTATTSRTDLRAAASKDSSFPSEHHSSSSSTTTHVSSRREVFQKAFAAVAGASFLTATTYPLPSQAALGTLPELADTNVVLQGMTVRVADISQQEQMIQFLQNAFDMIPLRYVDNGLESKVWMGYGPEQFSIPSNFELPVSSFAKYGGHASICISCNKQSPDVYFQAGEKQPPGNNIAYLQLGVPSYRISQMTKTGGTVMDAFGFVNVLSPCGLPMRAIVGISPDPIMLIAINTLDIAASTAFYNQLGFVEHDNFPYARPNKGQGQFEPPQPRNSVYLAPNTNSMGILLLDAKRGDTKIKGGGKTLKPNPAVASINLIYQPSDTGGAADPDFVEEPFFRDPQGVGVAFQSYTKFEVEEKATRVPNRDEQQEASKSELPTANKKK